MGVLVAQAYVDEMIYPGFAPKVFNGNENKVEPAKQRYEIAEKNLSPHACNTMD